MSRMRRASVGILVILLMVILTPRIIPDSEMQTQFITDHVGRLVEVPTQINKVFATTQAGSLFIYAVNSNALIGWNSGFSPETSFVFGSDADSLPILGTWNNRYKTVQTNRIQQLKPDLVVHFAQADLRNIDLINQMETELGIPVILVDATLDSLPTSLQLMGQLLGKETRGNILGLYAQNILDQLQFYQDVKPERQVCAYVASTTTDSYSPQLLEMVGIREIPIRSDLIFVIPHPVSDLYQEILKNAPLGARETVQRGHVYQVPDVLENWLQPTSIFRLLGALWLADIAYPSDYPINIEAKFEEFMEVFYEVKITPEILNWTFDRSGRNH